MQSFMRACAFLALLACAHAGSAQSQDPKTKWFQEAKFGLFIHWGLYAIPAGEWNGRMIPGPGELIMRNARIPVKEYEQLASRFNPTQFDAEAWVKFAEDSGMKYIVVTAKHYDGFAMYHSAVSKYNVFDATPFHRDPLKELAAACAKHGIRLGVYYSQSQDWHEPDGAGNDWDFSNNKDFDRYLRTKAEPQVKEILTGYGPVSVMRFDTTGVMNAPRAQRFLDIVHSLQPAALVVGPGGAAGDFLSIGDNRVPDTVSKGAWETAASINSTWGFRKDDNVWKSPDELIFRLVDIVSKGGNYLLNVGPTAEGIIPRPSLVTLESVGAWLKRNGEAIYGAGPTPLGQELGGTKWRCTTKEGKLFVTVFQWPDGPLELNQVKGKITRAYMLADASRAALPFTQAGGRVTIVLPKDPPFEGSLPDRIRADLARAAARAHVHTVIVLETLASR
jgi:alpha-L-fucosidase